jgi:pyruvate dehydrogenase E2 component (dihydrolipoamide acetyltransferase)
VPHYYLTADLNLDALLEIRAKLNADLPAEQQLSLNDMLLKAAALACRTVSYQYSVSL